MAGLDSLKSITLDQALGRVNCNFPDSLGVNLILAWAQPGDWILTLREYLYSWSGSGYVKV